MDTSLEDPSGGTPSLDPSAHTVLVVDDEEVVRMSLQQLLEGEGFRVLLANCGEDALGVLDTHAISMVITDVMMPGMTGLQLQDRLRAEAPDVPVMVITGFPTIERAVAAIQNGAVNFITKPFDIQTVLDTVSRTLRSRLQVGLNTATLAYGVTTHQFTVPGTMEHVGGLLHYFMNRTILTDYFPRATVFQIRLALDEVLVNAVRHGCHQNPRLKVHVSSTIDAREFEITVEDEGEGFNMAALADPTTEDSLWSLAEHGRGIFLCRCYMDEVEYNTKGNRVRMRKLNPVAVPVS